MKVKVNKNMWVEVKKRTLSKHSIGCLDMCCGNVDIECDECIFRHVLRIENSQLEIKED